MDERLQLTADNLYDLQNEWRNELDSKRKTKRTLEILRVIFNFIELMDLKDEFMEKFGEYIQSQYPFSPAHQVMASTKNLFYAVSADKAGDTTVTLSIPEKKLDITDKNLFKLLQKCGKIVLVLMKAHNKTKKREFLDKFIEFFKKLSDDGESNSAHFEEIVEPVKNFVSPSLSGPTDKDLSFGRPTSNNNQPKGDDRESTAAKEEIVGTKKSLPLKELKQNRIKGSVDNGSDALERTVDPEQSSPNSGKSEIACPNGVDSDISLRPAIQEKVEITEIPATNDNASISTIPGEEPKEPTGPALGSPSSTKTSDEDEQSEEEDVTDPGEELRTQYKKANRKRYEEHKGYFLTIEPEKSYESSVNNDPSNQDYVLTFDDAESNEIKHRFFEDEQQALRWAYRNVYRRGKKNVFIKVWKFDEENSSSLNTDDLMINQIHLIHPVESEIVVKKQGMYDTGADFASFPFNPTIVETFINSATEINGELQLTVYGKLSINGKEGEKIYEIDMDQDKTWCNISNRQIADLDDKEVEPILEEIKKIIYLKRKSK